MRIAYAQNQAEAEMIQGILLEEGIPSMLRRSGGFDVPDFLAAGPRDILVPAGGAHAARDVLLSADLEELVARLPSDEPPVLFGRHLLVGLLVAGGGFLTALVAWLLLGAGP